MPLYPPAIQYAIEHLSRLPGIGTKTAERLIFFLLQQPAAQVEKLAAALSALPQSIQRCSVCYNFSASSPCAICADAKRSAHLVCVVAKPQDVQALEKTHQFEGCYHVLGGVLDPLAGVSHEQLTIQALVQRLRDNHVQEVILALNPDLAGETTMLFLAKLLKPLNVRVTRLARGLPAGSDLEYADEITLGSALRDRQTLK